MSLAITSPRPGSVFNSAMVAVFTLIGVTGGGFFSAPRAALSNTSVARKTTPRDATGRAKCTFRAYDGFVVDARSQPRPGKTEESARKQRLPSSEDLLAPGGVIARLLPGYEARPQQMEMAARVEAALRDSGL